MQRRSKHTHTHGYGHTSPRQRGSVYIMVLGASLMVALIGVSSLMAARVQRRATTITADRIQARELARTGIDRLMWSMDVDPPGGFCRPMLVNGDYEDMAFAGGTFSVTGVDPIDGNLTNRSGDPVVLTSVGVYGQAKYVLEVTLNGDGSSQPGTWKRVVY
jgi:hypothetical protein